MTMRVPRLHVDGPLAAGGSVPLPEAASRHVTKVLRLGPGDPLILFDGRGGEYEAAVARVSRGAVAVEVGAYRPVDRESALAIELGQGVCRGDRMDLVVQKATELGVCAIRPVLCERSVVKLDPARARRRVEHWRAIAVHAAQQSGRTRAPDLGGVEGLESWLSRPGAGQGIFLSPQAASPISDLAHSGGAVRLLVGPEGGLSPREAECVRAAGFTGLRLGPRVLRTETAALAALSVLQAYWGDLR